MGTNKLACSAVLGQLLHQLDEPQPHNYHPDGRVKVPAFDSGTILFESHGLAISDIAISAEAYDRAKAAGVGREIEL